MLEVSHLTGWDFAVPPKIVCKAGRQSKQREEGRAGAGTKGWQGWSGSRAAEPGPGPGWHRAQQTRGAKSGMGALPTTGGRAWRRQDPFSGEWILRAGEDSKDGEDGPGLVRAGILKGGRVESGLHGLLCEEAVTNDTRRTGERVYVENQGQGGWLEADLVCTEGLGSGISHDYRLWFERVRETTVE